MKSRGWLLDVYINGEKTALWVKLETGEVARLFDPYTPDFYIEPKESAHPGELADILLDHPNILQVRAEEKFVSLHMRKRERVLHVYVDHVRNFRIVLRDLEKLRLIKAYYNVNLLHVQRYLFQRGFTPTGMVEAEYDETGRLLSLHPLEDALETDPPPFTALLFDVEISGLELTSQVDKDPISRIIVFDEKLRPEEVFEGDEKDVLSRFSEHVRIKDPDFLVSSSVEADLRHIIERAEILGLSVHLGREAKMSRLRRILPQAQEGRIKVNLHTFLRMGIAGIVERSRFTLAPPGLSAKWPAGRTIDSRQCYEALKRDILLPKTRGLFRHVTTAKDTVFRDRGGLILSPKAGLHENVAELDFESMFPQIIIKHNISYETVTPRFVDETRRGFLGELTKDFLERRLHFKHLRKKYSKNSQERLWCEQRQLALKEILVCTYGYSGCFANRFSNVAAYEEINRVARDTLVKTLNIAMRESFEAIYGDSDSIFVKRKNACRQDYEDLARAIEDEIGLPIALDNHYRFLVFLTQEAHPEMEAARRYFGKLTSGTLHCRGIELRRRDCPVFLKHFQKNLLDILFDAERSESVKREQYKKALEHVAETCNKIVRGDISLQDLVVSKSLRKPANRYKSLLPQVVAAKQMTHKGNKVKRREIIDFIYVNAAHSNPFRRVVPAPILDEEHFYYDKKKYLEMALDVAETILCTFGFNGKQLGSRYS